LAWESRIRQAMVLPGLDQDPADYDRPLLLPP
jgi:hypothetical protein